MRFFPALCALGLVLVGCIERSAPALEGGGDMVVRPDQMPDGMLPLDQRPDALVGVDAMLESDAGPLPDMAVGPDADVLPEPQSLSRVEDAILAPDCAFDVPEAVLERLQPQVSSEVIGGVVPCRIYTMAHMEAGRWAVNVQEGWSDEGLIERADVVVGSLDSEVHVYSVADLFEEAGFQRPSFVAVSSHAQLDSGVLYLLVTDQFEHFFLLVSDERPLLWRTRFLFQAGGVQLVSHGDAVYYTVADDMDDEGRDLPGVQLYRTVFLPDEQALTTERLYTLPDGDDPIYQPVGFDAEQDVLDVYPGGVTIIDGQPAILAQLQRRLRGEGRQTGTGFVVVRGERLDALRQVASGLWRDIWGVYRILIPEDGREPVVVRSASWCFCDDADPADACEDREIHHQLDDCPGDNRFMLLRRSLRGHANDWEQLGEGGLTEVRLDAQDGLVVLYASYENFADSEGERIRVFDIRFPDRPERPTMRVARGWYSSELGDVRASVALGTGLDGRWAALVVSNYAHPVEDEGYHRLLAGQVFVHQAE